MLLRAKALQYDGQKLVAELVPASQAHLRFPMVRIDADLTLSLEAALQNYEVIDATPEEREVLHRWGHPLGGVQ